MPKRIPTLDLLPAQPDKIGPCPDCGKPTPYRTNKALCEDCRAARTRERQRKAATVQRRKRGIAQVKGVEAKCDNCGTTIIRRTRTHRLCEACAPDEQRKYARNRVNRLSRERGAPQVGSMLNCGKCGTAFALAKKGRQFYCEACRLPPRRKPGDPIPVRLCADCGVPLPVKLGRGPKHVRCEECGDRHKKHADLGRYYKRSGREADLSAGSEVKCETCDNRFIRTRADHRFCEGCLQTRNKDYNNLKRDADRRANGVPLRSGITLQCDHCGEEFIKQANRHRFCRKCKNQPVIQNYLKRLKEDPAFAFRCSISRAVYKSLDRMKAGASWEKLLGYTLTDLVRHIERQFTEEMNWKNRGSYWHLDHIRPLAQFNFSGPDDQDFKDAWALWNLRPLRAEDNLKKSDQRLFLI
jgi:hypothetical protein